MNKYKYDHKVPHYIEGRKRPICYVLDNFRNSPLAVIGHYEGTCGGCDTITAGYPKLFGVIRERLGEECNILFEGLLVSADVNWTAGLHRDYPVTIILLTTGIKDCIGSINVRRRARMGSKYTPVDPLNTENKHRAVVNAVNRLEKQGVKVHRASRRSALYLVKKELEL